MADYIEREALYEKAYWHGETPDVENPYSEGVEAVDVSDIDNIPAADVAPVVHGRWVDVTCTNCGQVDFSKPNYCPNCGAKMDLEVT